MWGALFSFLGGPVIQGIIDGYKLKLQNATQQDALAADLAAKEILGEVAQRQAEASIIRQEQGWWLTALPRPLIAFIVIVLLAKLLVYDKALGQWTGGHTDALSPEMWEVIRAVIYAYFGGRTIEKVARIFKR